jgi:hypothetical protein
MDYATQAAVDEAAEAIGLTAQTLRAAFPRWRIWESGGRWLASCGGSVGSWGPQSLIHPVVISGDLSGLAGQLELQEWLRSLTPDELKAAWIGGPAAVRDDNPAGRDESR